jgi:hypothetical protein
MILNLSILDNLHKFRNISRMHLDFEKSRWSIPADNKESWAPIGPSTEGAFEIKGSNIIWIWDQRPGEKNTIIIWDPPTSESDYQHAKGEGRIFAQQKADFNDGTIRWEVDSASR